MFAFLDPILAPVYEFIGGMLYWFSEIFDGHYVFGLLIYALLFKLLFLPFSIKQQKNQIKMATLTPKIELIKAKYKGRTDQATMQKQQQEIMDLQQKEGYNPLSGCLPLLLQMPIIMFLYKIIRSPLSYICGFSADEITKIKEIIGSTQVDEIQLIGELKRFGTVGLEEFADRLTKLPKFELPGAMLSDTPWESLTDNFNLLDYKLFGGNIFHTAIEDLPENFSWLFLVPIVAGVLTWLSMYLSRKWNSSAATQPQQEGQAAITGKLMDLMMPAMTIFMAFGFSGLMGIYWIYQSAFGILQTFILSKAMPLPKFTEEDVKELKRQQKEAEKNARNAAKEAPKTRSLHYIDDEDYDTLPEVKSDDKNDKNSGSMDLPEI